MGIPGRILACKIVVVSFLAAAPAEATATRGHSRSERPDSPAVPPVRLLPSATLLGLNTLARLPTPSVRAGKRPGSGLGFLISGSILTGLGVLNFAGTGICFIDGYRETVGESGFDVCVYGSLIAGSTFTAIGLPLLITGIVKRSAYNDWMQRHAFLEVDPRQGQLLLGWRGEL